MEVPKIKYNEFLNEIKKHCEGKYASVAFRIKYDGRYAEEILDKELINKLELEDCDYEIINFHIYDKDFNNVTQNLDFIKETLLKYPFNVIEVAPKI